MDTVEKRKKLFERACEGFLNALYIEKGKSDNITSDDIDVVWEALLLSLHKFEPNLREIAEEVCDKIVENKI